MFVELMKFQRAARVLDISGTELRQRLNEGRDIPRHCSRIRKL